MRSWIAHAGDSLQTRVNLDYKELFAEDRLESVGELARDILGFSNREGASSSAGLLTVHKLVGHRTVNFRTARETLGLFLGTRVNFDLDECRVSVQGSKLQRRGYKRAPRAVHHVCFACVAIAG